MNENQLFQLTKNVLRDVMRLLLIIPTFIQICTEVFSIYFSSLDNVLTRDRKKHCKIYRVLKLETILKKLKDFSKEIFSVSKEKMFLLFITRQLRCKTNVPNEAKNVTD